MNENEYILNMVNENKELAPLMEVFESIMELDDNQLNDPMVEILKSTLGNVFTTNVRQQAIEQIVNTLESTGTTSAKMIEIRNNMEEGLNGIITALNPSEAKEALLKEFAANFISIYDEAIDKFNGFDIVLPIKLDEGAQMPTYAHDTDAAADLYAKEDITIPAHTSSNLIDTGVHIQLPHNWRATIIPRSSIGMKTGLRLSNSQGCIDEEYRGSLGVIYDNISDSDYEIKAGDRIAQMYVEPVYRFKGTRTEELTDTDRGTGGYGSTGK